MRIAKTWLGALVVVASLALMLSGCAVSGTSYLALDYNLGTVTYLYFPALPAFINWGQYYEHPEGTYSGSYENIGSYDDFLYTIKVNRGVGFIFGAPGDDRYYTMMLEPTGPELSFFDVSASLEGKSSKASAAGGGLENAPIDKSRYDLDHPEPFSYQRSSNGVTFSVIGNRYHLK